jgi:hypothetical protein
LQAAFLRPKYFIFDKLMPGSPLPQRFARRSPNLGCPKPATFDIVGRLNRTSI